MHHQIGIVARRIRPGAVDEQHLGRVWRAIEVFEILKEPRAVTEQLEGGCEPRQPLAEPVGIRSLTVFPVVCIGGRVGQEHQPDQKLETAEIEVGPGPVGPQNVSIGHLPGRNHPARTALPDNGDPGVIYQIEGHEIVHLEKKGLLPTHRPLNSIRTAGEAVRACWPHLFNLRDLKCGHP